MIPRSSSSEKQRRNICIVFMLIGLVCVAMLTIGNQGSSTGRFRALQQPAYTSNSPSTEQQSSPKVADGVKPSPPAPAPPLRRNEATPLPPAPEEPVAPVQPPPETPVPPPPEAPPAPVRDTAPPSPPQVAPSVPSPPSEGGIMYDDENDDVPLPKKRKSDSACPSRAEALKGDRSGAAPEKLLWKDNGQLDGLQTEEQQKRMFQSTPEDRRVVVRRDTTFGAFQDAILRAISTTQVQSSSPVWYVSHHFDCLAERYGGLRSGFIAEAGVSEGKTLSKMYTGTRDGFNGTHVGFDSFKGLPMNWHGHFKVGSFAADKAAVRQSVPSEVQLYVGQFERQIDKFLKRNPRKALSFAHIDGKVVTSNAVALSLLSSRFAPGSFLCIGDMYGFQEYGQHALLAFYLWAYEHQVTVSSMAFAANKIYRRSACFQIMDLLSMAAPGQPSAPPDVSPELLQSDAQREKMTAKCPANRRITVASSDYSYKTFAAKMAEMLNDVTIGARPINHLLNNAEKYFNDYGMLQKRSLWTEFGVFYGASLNLTAHTVGRAFPDVTIAGFDSFAGFPVDWRKIFPKGSFNVHEGWFETLKKQLPATIDLNKGWFQDTVVDFLGRHPSKPLTFIHHDGDIFISTAVPFSLMAHRIVPGTLMCFDELIGYPEWLQHEILALYAWMHRHEAEVCVVSVWAEWTEANGPPEVEAPFQSACVQVTSVRQLG